MKTLTLNSERELNNLFDFNFQPYKIKSVNGIAVNVNGGSLIYNELEVTNNHVTISSYFVEKQGHTTTSLKAPFIIEF